MQQRWASALSSGGPLPSPEKTRFLPQARRWWACPCRNSHAPRRLPFVSPLPQPHGASASSSAPFLAAGQTMRRPSGSITGQYAHFFGASLMARMVKNLPAVWKTQARSLGGEDPLEEGMATHCTILAWRIPWTERSLADYGPWSQKKSDTAEGLITHTHKHQLGRSLPP